MQTRRTFSLQVLLCNHEKENNIYTAPRNEVGKKKTPLMGIKPAQTDVRTTVTQPRKNRT